MGTVSPSQLTSVSHSLKQVVGPGVAKVSSKRWLCESTFVLSCLYYDSVTACGKDLPPPPLLLFDLECLSPSLLHPCSPSDLHAPITRAPQLLQDTLAPFPQPTGAFSLESRV